MDFLQLRNIVFCSSCGYRHYLPHFLSIHPLLAISLLLFSFGFGLTRYCKSNLIALRGARSAGDKSEITNGPSRDERSGEDTEKYICAIDRATGRHK